MVFSIMMLGKLDIQYICIRMRLGLYLMPHIKNELKKVNNLNIKAKNKTLLKKKVRINVHNFHLE